MWLFCRRPDSHITTISESEIIIQYISVYSKPFIYGWVINAPLKAYHPYYSEYTLADMLEEFIQILWLMANVLDSKSIDHLYCYTGHFDTFRE